MSSQIIPVDPFDYIVFGGTGDLAERKLLPALYYRQAAGQISEPTRIIGVSRSEKSREEYRTFTMNALKRHVKPNDFDKNEADKFVRRMDYVALDARSDKGWDIMVEKLAGRTDYVRAFYMAVGPSLFGDISEKIRQYKLITDKTRVVIEKPLGQDLASARALNATIARVFKEEQIFRIDHYLGKETVQNLMALRFANVLYEPLWNSAHIDHVQINVLESVGLEGRAGYYDNSGALRDMVQNHLVQLMCLVAMEPPAIMNAESVRDEKLKILQSLKPINIGNSDKVTVRGQYKAGASIHGPVSSYLDELGRSSQTETYVAIKAEIHNWRWNGVPFYLRTGKRMPNRVSEIVVNFKKVPHSIFSEADQVIYANQLVIRLQPDEGVKQWIMIKDPGPGGMRLRHVPLDMSFAENFDVRHPDAYERLLLDVIRNNQTLFMRGDEVEAAWQWIDPILNAWSQTGQMAQPYTAGTYGPSQAIGLIERDGRTWYDHD